MGLWFESLYTGDKQWMVMKLAVVDNKLLCPGDNFSIQESVTI